MFDDLINPKTAEQLRARAVKAENDRFYKDLLNNEIFRGKRLEDWAKHGFGDANVIEFMMGHGRSAKEIQDVLEKYQTYRTTGVLSMKSRIGVEPNVLPQQPPQQRRKWSVCSTLRHKAVTSWHRSQTGHRSHYSVERLLAFRDYYERTSFVRVCAVCFLTPIPALLMALAVDCIPLAPPSKGWQGNYMLWIRLLVAIFLVSVGLVLQAQEVIVARTISSIDMIKIACVSSISYVLVSIAVSIAWRFPVPFGYVLMVPPYVMIFWIFTLLNIGPRVLQQSPLLRQQIKSQLMIIITQGLLAVTYPIFSAVFNHLSGAHQAAFIFVMPIIKFATKQMVATAADKLHEYVGQIVVFSVDVFNVYYVAICMQAAGSTFTTVVIAASDSFHLVLAVRDIFHDSNTSRENKQSLETPGFEQTHLLKDLSGLVRTVFQKIDPIQARSCRVRVRAPFPLPLCDDSKALLDECLKAVQIVAIPSANNKSTCNSKLLSQVGQERLQVSAPLFDLTSFLIGPAHRLTRSRTRIFDTAALTWQPTQKNLIQVPFANEISEAREQNSNATAFQEVLQTLFHSEYVLMAEYMEFMLPMLYALYLAAMYQLPVAAYYPHTANMSPEKLKTTVGSILVFSVIEFVGFVGLLVVLKRKFDFLPMYQLAFVLEMQWRSIHGHLIVWNFYILHLTLVHCVQDRQHSCRINNFVRILVKTYDGIAASWHRIQIGHREHYSVERVLASRDYCERTPLTRAIAVCISTPVPAATVTIWIECIPLKDPKEGWKANWTMGVRVLVTSFFVGGEIVLLARTIVEEGKISMSRALGITIASALFYTALGVLLAATWKFPIPFGLVIMVCPFVSFILNLILLSIDRDELKKNKNLQKQLIGHITATAAQSLLVVAYPTFNAVFLQLSGVHQAISMFALPVIKFITKQVIARVATHLEDYVGVMVVFSVDVFNVLYVAICMQTARSPLTTVLIMSSDILHIVLALRNIYHHTNCDQGQNDPGVDSKNYIDSVLANLKKFNPRTNPYAGSIRLWTPYKLPLSDSSKKILRALASKWNPPLAALVTQGTFTNESPVPYSKLGPSTQLIQPIRERDVQTTSKEFWNTTTKPATEIGGRQVAPVSFVDGIVPQVKTEARSRCTERNFNAPTISSSQPSTRRTVDGKLSRRNNKMSLKEGLQVLFYCEYVILTEYIECMLPLVYAGYLAVLYYLPTARYYPFTRSLTTAKLTSTLVQLITYGSLEYLSFVGMHVLLKKRLGYSPVYQLAFVLETHAVKKRSQLEASSSFLSIDSNAFAIVLSFLSNQAIVELQSVTGARYPGSDALVSSICCQCENDELVVANGLCLACNRAKDENFRRCLRISFATSCNPHSRTRSRKCIKPFDTRFLL